MFSCVVYRQDNGRFKVEYTSETGFNSKVLLCNTVEDLPEEIRLKIKQMLWVDPSDQTMTQTLGIRIGDNIFWIV